MVVNDVVNVQYNGGFLHEIILLALCYYLPSGNPIKWHDEEVFCLLC